MPGIPAGVAWSLVLNASTAARSSGTASGYPTAIRVAKPSSSRSVAVGSGPGVPGRPQRGAGHFQGSRADRVLAGYQCRLQGLEEHRADQGRVGRINGGDGVQQEAGSILVPREEDGDRGPQALRRHVQSRFRQPGRRQVQHGLGQGTVPRDEIGLGRGEEPHGTAPRIRGKVGRPGQERGLCDVAAAPFRARGRAVEVSRDILVGQHAGRGAVPRCLVRVAALPGDARQGLVHPATVARPCPLVDRGTDERVPERHSRVNRHDVLSHGRIGGVRLQAQQRGRPPERGGVIARCC